MLAARAPGLQEQLELALVESMPYLILDGAVVDTDLCREKTLSREGKEAYSPQPSQPWLL